MKESNGTGNGTGKKRDSISYISHPLAIYLEVIYQKDLAERVGFEPTYSFLSRNPISSRTRYDLFGTSPA